MLQLNYTNSLGVTLMQYGDLIVVEDLGKNDADQKLVKVKCTVCNRTKVAKEYVLKQGRGTTHSACGRGLKTANKKFYAHWQNLRTRTNNPNYDHASSYSGISSKEFELFIDFYDAMYDSYIIASEKYGEANITLDRIDPSKDYCKVNCRWVDKDIQGSNVKRSKLKKAVSPQGEIIYFRSTVKFAKKHDISASTIRDYLNPKTKLSSAKGWHFEICNSNDYRKISDVL